MSNTEIQIHTDIEDIQKFVGKELLMWVNARVAGHVANSFRRGTNPKAHPKIDVAFVADKPAEGPEAANFYAAVHASHPGAAVRFLGVGLHNNVIAHSQQDRIFVHLKPLGWEVKPDRLIGKALEKFKITCIQVRPGVKIAKVKKEPVHA